MSKSKNCSVQFSRITCYYRIATTEYNVVPSVQKQPAFDGQLLIFLNVTDTPSVCTISARPRLFLYAFF